MKTSEILNNTVWATIKTSKIHGVGVIAIRDIPKGTTITDNTIDNKELKLSYLIDEEDFNKIIPEIQQIILDRMLYKEDQFEFIINPNADAILQSFMNHSDTPNTNGRVALIDIKKGEELTEDFRPYIKNGHRLTKQHLSKFLC